MHSCEGCSGHTGCEQSLDEIKFENSIFNACVYGDLEKIKKMVKNKGLEILNEQDKNGYSSLHYAARNGHFEICEYLVRNGVNVNLKTKSCFSTPLHRAAFVGNAKIVKLLLENKANIHEQDCDGKTAMHKSIEEYLRSKSQKHLEVIQILDKFDSNLKNLKDKYDKSSKDVCPDLFD